MEYKLSLSLSLQKIFKYEQKVFLAYTFISYRDIGINSSMNRSFSWFKDLILIALNAILTCTEFSRYVIFK